MSLEPANNREIYARLEEIHNSIEVLIREYRDIQSAFPKNDENEPDYEGHRAFHRAQVRRVEQNTESIAALKRNVLTWAAIGVLTIVASTLVEVFVQPLLNNMK